VLHAGTVAQRVDARSVVYPQVAVDEYAGAMVFLDLQASDERGRFDARGPDRGVGRYLVSVRDKDGIGSDVLYFGAVDDLHSLRGQPAGGGVYQGRIQAVQDVIPGVEQHYPNAVEVHVRIVVL
jgi:hypothetical protein